MPAGPQLDALYALYAERPGERPILNALERT
jgi:hypothetical protein